MPRKRATNKRTVIVRRARDALTTDSRGILSLLVGGLAGFMMNTKMVKESEWLREHWYALPIALLLIGYMLTRRRNPHGKTLMALGGYLFMNGFMNKPKEAKKKADTAGFDDVPGGGQWVVTPEGQWVLMPAWQSQQYRETAAPALPARTTDGIAAQTLEDVYGRV